MCRTDPNIIQPSVHPIDFSASPLCQTSQTDRQTVLTCVAGWKRTFGLVESEKSETRMAKKAPRKLPSCFQRGMGESGLSKMTFNGKVYYCSQKDDCNFICNKLRTENIAMVGFDMEWKVTFTSDVRKTALIQLCPSQDICYLFHIVMMNGFPSELRLILESDVTIKVGVGINSDMEKLRKDFNIKPSGYLDLSDFANKKIRSNEKWSLNGLTMYLFKQRINKDSKIRCGDWEQFPLSSTQEEYAAIDAYVSYAIYCKLTESE